MNTISPETVVDRINVTEPLEHRKPVEHLVAELRQVSSALQEELPAFVARGVPRPFCMAGPRIADELELREANWSQSRGGTPEQKQAWKKVYPEAEEMCTTFVDSLEMMLIDNDEAMRAIDFIREGEGPEDLLMDFVKRVEVARSYPEAAQAAGYTTDRINEIARKGKEYADIYAKTLALPGGSIPAKIDRDKARHFAELYLSRVRFHADRVFRGNPEKRAKFTSKYQAKRTAEYKARQKAAKQAESESADL